MHPHGQYLNRLFRLAGICTVRGINVSDQPLNTAFRSKHILQEHRQCLILCTPQEGNSTSKFSFSPCCRQSWWLESLHGVRNETFVQSGRDYGIDICKKILPSTVKDRQTFRRLWQIFLEYDILKAIKRTRESKIEYTETYRMPEKIGRVLATHVF